MQFVMVDGQIEPGLMPGDSPGFAAAIGALYGASYTLKFMSKKRAENPIDYGVMALEGLWTTPEGGADYATSDQWQWTLMIMQPDHITADMFAEAVEQLRQEVRQGGQGRAACSTGLRLERFEEGLCVQVMHIGPYADEPATLTRMGEFAGQNGYQFIGRHHEIYLGDPRTAKPENLKTVLRHAGRADRVSVPRWSPTRRRRHRRAPPAAARGHAPASPRRSLLAAALLAVFVVLAVASGPDSALSAWDRRVSDAFIAWRTPGRSQFFWAITLLGNVAGAGRAELLRRSCCSPCGGGGRGPSWSPWGMLIGWGISEAAKADRRPAPAAATTPSSRCRARRSMPSGHALTTLVFLGLLVYVAFRWRRGGRASRAGGRRGAAGAGRRPVPRRRGWAAAGWWAVALCRALHRRAHRSLARLPGCPLAVRRTGRVVPGRRLAGRLPRRYLGVRCAHAPDLR